MFEALSHLALQQYWWVIISLLASLLVFLMFVQGGQTLIRSLGKTDNQQKIIVNALGRKWEFTFTTLVTFGGAFFASFPLFYATSFGGAYWVWMAILIAFVVQAVSYEFRTKPNNLFGKRFYEVMLFLNGLLGTVLIGTAVATFFTGSMFSLNEINNSVTWEGPAYGLEAALSIHNVSLGLAVFFLSRVLAILYFMNAVDSEEINSRGQKRLIWESGLFLVFFLFFLVKLLLIDGFAYEPVTMEVSMVANKYWHNFLEMPINTILFLAGVVLVLSGIYLGIFKAKSSAIWFAGPGTVLTVFALFILAGFNQTAFYPSTFDIQNSLTIENASSSKFTLTAMSYVSLLVPFVFAYIWYAWKAINNKKIDEEEMQEDSHAY